MAVAIADMVIVVVAVEEVGQAGGLVLGEGLRLRERLALGERLILVRHRITSFSRCGLV